MRNLTTITGILTKDSEIKFFESGNSKAIFSLAIDSYIDGKKQTSFFNCEIWNKKAEFVSTYFKKGNLVTVSGELSRSVYNEKVYYTLKCNNAGFSNAQMVVNGEIVATGEKKLEILNSETHFEVNFFGKEPPSGVHTAILNVAFQDYKPIFTLIGVID